MRIWRKKVSKLVPIFISFVVLAAGMLIHISEASRANNTFRCRICEGLPFHAPCLIDLSTGDVLELSVFDNDPVRQGELSDIQSTGNFSFTMSGGMLAAKDAGYSCQASISLEPKTANTALFCEACKEELSNTPNTGIVLADLYDLENIQYYIIEENAEYLFRDYKISIERHTNTEELLIFVTGSK